MLIHLPILFPVMLLLDSSEMVGTDGRWGVPLPCKYMMLQLIIMYSFLSMKLNILKTFIINKTHLEEFFPVSGCCRFRKQNKDYKLSTTNTFMVLKHLLCSFYCEMQSGALGICCATFCW